MEESVFDVLDELEYETNVNCNTGHINPRPDQPQLRSNELLCQSNNGRQQYIRNQWPQEWENEANDVFPLDDFGRTLQRSCFFLLFFFSGEGLGFKCYKTREY